MSRLGGEMIVMSEENIKGSLDSILMKENVNKLEEQVRAMNQEKKEGDEKTKTLQDEIIKINKHIADIEVQNNKLTEDNDDLRKEGERLDKLLEKAWGERNSSGENAGNFLCLRVLVKT